MATTLSQPPISEEALIQNAGKWVALRAGEVVAAADDYDALVARPGVEQTDAVYLVPRTSALFYLTWPSIGTPSPSTLTLPYAAHGPLLLLQLDAGSSLTVVPAAIDSGAARSMFPMQIAKRLTAVRRAACSPCRSQNAWESPRRWCETRRALWGWRERASQPGLTMRACRHRFSTSGGGQPGAQFTLNPAFCDKGAFLLGREDFFARFRVAFDPGDPLPTFSIS